MPNQEQQFKTSVQNSDKAHSLVDNFRHQLAHIDALPQLTLLGLLSGVLAASVILLFRLGIDFPLEWFSNNHGFEQLNPMHRFIIIMAAAFLIGIIFHFIDPKSRQVSVPHVLDRLHRHEGHLPLKNIVVQFFGGILTQVSGQSMGREGPAIHLGAGIASQLGQWLKLPNNSLRTLVGCGVASAIAASFNTPIAGVIFAMEVVLMEYTITGFIPVILASVTGATLSHMAFDNTLNFTNINAELTSLWELPYIALCGLAIAIAAGLYSKIHLWAVTVKRLPIFIKISLAGLVTALISLKMPQVMGDGYDTIMQASAGNLSISFLVILVAAKILASALASGSGMPGGVIGPSLVIGACLGSALGEVGALLSPLDDANASLYVLLGMTAMMAALLNAPLAALLAVLELSHNPNIILPAMLMISVACVCTRQWFTKEGLFQHQLRILGSPIDNSLDQQMLSRSGVRSVMTGRFSLCPIELSLEKAQSLLRSKPLWLVIESDEGQLLMAAADLSRHLDELSHHEDGDVTDTDVNLLNIPAKRLNTSAVDQGSNLYQARKSLRQIDTEALLICRHQKQQQQIIGIITTDIIDKHYA